MPNPENLNKRVPFKKNDPRINRKGRPPKLPELRELIDLVMGTEIKGKTAAQEILEAVKRKAKKGDVRAAELLFDRSWGKAKQEIDFLNKGITTIRIIRDKEL